MTSENSGRHKGKTALITGASTGIGRELAKEFAKDKINVILVARNQKLLEELANKLQSKFGVTATVIAKDLIPTTSANELYEAVTQLGMNVHYLVNNAGFGDYALFHKSSLKKQEDMIRLNVTSLTQLTHLFLPQMIKRKEGTILNVASTASFQPGPFMSVYFATKHYVLAFSEALSEELKEHNIGVSCLCPGPTESKFGENAGFGKADPNAKSKFPSSAEVARFGYQKMKQGKVVSIHGFGNTLKATLNRFFSRKFVRRMAYRIMKN